MKTAWIKIAVFSLAGLCSLLAYAAMPGYRVIKKIQLGGEGNWSYPAVDSGARRLYLPRGTHVMVDMETGKLVGDIPETPGVHGIALVPELNRGYTCNRKNDTVTVFDLQTLAVVGQIKTGANPRAILYDPASKNIFTFNGSSRDATVLNAASRDVVGTIVLDGRPEFAVADGRGKIYVNIKDKNEIAEIDGQKLVVTRRFSLLPGEKPRGMALDVERRRIFSGCCNQIMVILDIDTGTVIATVPIGAGVDGNEFDPQTGLIFSANGWDGTLTVVQESSPGKFEVAETIPTQRGARTLVLDPKTHCLYLPTAQLGFFPATTPDSRKQKPPIIQDTFMVLVVGK